MKVARVNGFLSEFKSWAAGESQIQAVALIGSYARSTSTPESDVDLIVVLSSPNLYLKHRQWTSLFGDVDREQIEDYGKCTSLRVWYADGLQVEYGFVDESWSAEPIDPGTRQIISGGMKILFERESVLSRAI